MLFCTIHVLALLYFIAPVSLYRFVYRYRPIHLKIIVSFCRSFCRVLAMHTTYKACTGICEHSVTSVAYPGGERVCV